MVQESASSASGRLRRRPAGINMSQVLLIISSPRVDSYSTGVVRKPAGGTRQDTYLKTILGFIGIIDVEVIAVEGIAFVPEVAERALDTALARVDAIAP